jgi:hypothetical protein
VGHSKLAGNHDKVKVTGKALLGRMLSQCGLLRPVPGTFGEGIESLPTTSIPPYPVSGTEVPAPVSAPVAMLFHMAVWEMF